MAGASAPPGLPKSQSLIKSGMKKPRRGLEPRNSRWTALKRVLDISPSLCLIEPLLITFWRWKFGYRCRDENSQYKRCRFFPFIRHYNKHRKEQAHEHNKEIVVAIAFEFMVKLVKHLVSYFLSAFMASTCICLSASCSISRWALAVLDWPKMPSKSIWQQAIGNRKTK